MNKKLIEQAAYRFSGWKLPEDFAPDNGISFVRNKYHDRYGMPIGTNLFHHGQVMKMFEYCLDIPAESEPQAFA
jgi:hypothetical protein